MVVGGGEMGREGVVVLASVNERTKSVLTRVSGDAVGRAKRKEGRGVALGRTWGDGGGDGWL